MPKRTIDSFYKKIDTNNIHSQVNDPNISNLPTTNNEPHTTSEKSPMPSQDPNATTVEVNTTDGTITVERDPGKRKPIWEYPVNVQDLARRAYIMLGPYQPTDCEFQVSRPENNQRRFQPHWYKHFSWLEYSPYLHKAYCFYCYLFSKKPMGRPGSDTFTIKGFDTWKRVSGKDCAFISHIGRDNNSAHNYSVVCYENLKNQTRNIQHVIQKQTTKEILDGRLRLKTSIDVVRWLTFQSCAFRARDEKPDSKNRGNFLEMVEFLASYNDEVNKVVLKNDPQNATYTSPLIQKQILHCFARNVQSSIREEIGSAKFGLIVDEARDESKREQMGIVLRFVDRKGYVRERFLDLVHLKDTTSATLKENFLNVLSQHNLAVKNIRGQGYDGASNMRGEWNGLQALILNECPYAYYVHCLAHQLQLTLVVASREVADVHTFFQQLSFIINVVVSSSKRNDELREEQVLEIAHLIEIEELETGRGLNQLGTLQRAGDTRWSSHFKSICSLMRLFGPTCRVLGSIIADGNYSARANARSSLKILNSFEFVFILHVLKEIMGLTEILCKAFQQKNQDILNAMNLLTSTKSLLLLLRNDGWAKLIENVKSFCQRQEIPIPDLDALYSDIIGSRRVKDRVTVEHHYRFDIFTGAIDQQVQELNNRFGERITRLLILSTALDPRNSYESFDINAICELAEKFYPMDFNEHERALLRCQLQHYQINVSHDPEMGNLSNISELCQTLVRTRKSEIFSLVDRILRLVLTLPVSTATTERAFSAMKIVKTRLRNRMEDDFLTNYLIVYIEKEIAGTFSTDKIIDDFDMMQTRRVPLRIKQ